MDDLAAIVFLTAAATLRTATPLILCAMGGLFSEKSGIVDVGLEGKMLMAAFFGASAAALTGSAWWGVAAAIGAALGAEKLILCTGAPGILERVEDPTSLISYTDLRGLERLREEGRIADGMLPKAKAIENAIHGGVRRIHVVSYKSPEGILGEVFTNEGTGTLIVADVNALTPAEQQSAGA